MAKNLGDSGYSSDGSDADFLSELLEEMSEGLLISNKAGKITFWNRAAEKITGYSKTEMIGKDCRLEPLFEPRGSEKSICETKCPLKGEEEDGKRTEEEVYLRHKGGYRIPAVVRIRTLRSSSREVVASMEVFNEADSIRETRRELMELRELAFVDSLTTLPNRRALDARLDSLLIEHRRYGWRAGVLMIDIDHFKEVNDRFGHRVGDKVLRNLGRTLRTVTRSVDLIGRWGGDEFVGLFREVDSKSLARIAERLRRVAEESEIYCGDSSLSFSVSIGGGLIGAEDTAETSIDRADKALSDAKSGGRNQVLIVGNEVAVPRKRRALLLPFLAEGAVAVRRK